MEVHPHIHTPRKKWTHYFWEFFMLFLAVFFGFLAEVQVEHTIEHGRERNFMKTLIVDLRAEVMSLASNEIKITIREQQLDSLVKRLDQKRISVE